MSTRWRHHTDLGWADHAIDLRRWPEEPVPAVLPDPVDCGASILRLGVPGDPEDCWTVTPYTVPGTGPGERSTSILVIVAPDGWRGGLLVTRREGEGFAYVAVRDLLPYLGRLLLPGRSSPGRLAQLREMARFGLPMLRRTVTDPDGWHEEMPTGLAHRAEPDAMVRWASCGVSAADTFLLHLGTPPISQGYRRGPDLFAWWAAGITDPAEVARWLDADVRRPVAARDLIAHGWSAGEVARWRRTPLVGWPRVSRDGVVMWLRAAAWLRGAGWTPEAVRRVASQVVSAADADPATPATVTGEITAWAQAMAPARAVAYLGAGYRREEAVAAETGPTPPGETDLSMLAALLPAEPRPPWHLLTLLTADRLGSPADLDPSLDG